MPLVGFGTAGLGENTAQAVTWALEAGYRLLDSAQAREWYREDLVGEALLKTSVPRPSLFITSKCERIPPSRALSVLLQTSFISPALLLNTALAGAGCIRGTTATNRRSSR